MNKSGERFTKQKNEPLAGFDGSMIRWRLNIMKHKLEYIRALKEMLAQLPALEAGAVDLTTLEAVKLLRPEVASLQRKGYSFEMIAKILEERGFIVTATTLKKYRSARKPDSQRKGAKKDATAPPRPMPAQPAPSGGIAKTARQAVRSGTDTDTKQYGGFTPREDTRNI
jgi:hypothetical protein